MSHDQPATIAVFKWNEELPPLPVPTDPKRISQDDGEELTYQAARPAAAALLAALQQAGHAAADETFGNGDLGWHFVASSAGRAYSLFVHWTGIEGADYLAIQPALRRGWLAALFLASPPSEALLPVKQMLSDALDRLPSVAGVRWLTESQFSAAYCRGERLPTP